MVTCLSDHASIFLVLFCPYSRNPALNVQILQESMRCRVKLMWESDNSFRFANANRAREDLWRGSFFSIFTVF